MNSLKITSFGTTTLLFDDGRDQILFDAHFSRPSIGQALFTKLKVDHEIIQEMMEKHDFSRLKAIFVSHSHYDHVLDAPYLAQITGAKLYGSPSTINVGRGAGLADSQLETFQADQACLIGDYQIRIIPSIHSNPNPFNDDLGQEIEEPLSQPNRVRAYKEGGSFDFYIQHGKKSYLIHPSCNYIEGNLKGWTADLLFLALAGITKMKPEEKETYFDQTIGQTQANLVIPIHWDNFFVSLAKPTKAMPQLAEHTDQVLFELVQYCEDHGINTLVQLPRTSFDF